MKIKLAPLSLRCSIALVMLAGGTSPALAQSLQGSELEEFVIIGSREAARQVAGSGAVITPKQMQVEAATDINQLLKTIPGIYIREEEGLGLRPNIGIRGATSERSSKVTLMEDGVLMAPAPYADPAAYYFPTTQRQSAVEVLKGAPLLRYGPQTTGGVLNMVSTPVPGAAEGHMRVMADGNGSTDLHGRYGTQYDQWNWMLETVQRNGSGFKNIDRHSNRGDFRIEDYVAKIGWQSDNDSRNQSLLLKMQYSEESSEETYLGLTDADFDQDSTRRYGMSAIDEMNNRHSSLQLTYRVDLMDNLTASATAYDINFKRNWYKLANGGGFINDANAGDSTARDILHGVQDVSGLNYKNNNRSYFSRGVDLNFNLQLDNHSLDAGVRIHEDEVDRFQIADLFDQIDGTLHYSSTILPGSGDNRVGGSEALALWLVDNWQVTDALKVTAALRHESVDTAEVRYSDLDRSNVARHTPNDVSEWLPGASLTYDLNDDWQLLAGVHRGFSPLGAGAGDREDPETSTNWETGVRYNSASWYLEGVAFYSDFSDKTENCSLASPCSDGSTSGSYTTGEAVVGGVELQASAVFQHGRASIPVDIAYTWTDAEVSDDNPVTGVMVGDLLKDIPEHVYSLRAGLELDNGWNSYLIAKYLDRMCSGVGCNRSGSDFAETESLFVVDLISHYDFSEQINVFLKLENVFDEQRIVSRNPQGARPNKPRIASLGVDFSF
ncbi:MAG: TonB-dependent receptor [Pseudohongiellaceae bacterium]